MIIYLYVWPPQSSAQLLCTPPAEQRYDGHVDMQQRQPQQQNPQVKMKAT